MFIIGLALNVICVLVIMTFVRSVFFKEDVDVLNKQFNVGSENSVAFKYVMWALYAWLGAVVLSFVLVPLIVVVPFIKLVAYVLAWNWVYESYKAGFFAKWVADIKEAISK